MNQTKEYLPFDLIDQELEGNITIEASAGTGKTFSIAVLVVRLILEKKIPIEKILLVTFTEAAAAELKERTARFIRLALKEIDEANSCDNEAIKKVVKKTSEISDEDKKELLNQALLDIDKATMSTIHSFCQETLNEFAFETGQVYGKELMKDISEVVEHELNEYWRSNIVNQDFDFLKSLKIQEYDTWKKAIKNTMDGKKLVGPFVEINSESDFENFKEKSLNEAVNNIENGQKILHDDLINEFNKDLDHFRNRIEKTNNGVKYLIDGKTFYDYLSKSPAYKFDTIFAEEIAKIKDVKNSIKESNKKITIVKNTLPNQISKQVAHFHLNQAIEALLPKIKSRLEEKNAFTFDDLIQSLHEKRENEELQCLMREKYKAVFVDEFQDTDPYQYGIFKAFFQDHDESILFYIGDPKQSIYGWRKADLHTYNSAKKSARMEVLSMNKNYRSSEKFIKAANTFFELDKETNLEYISVESVNNINPGLEWKDKSKDDFPSIFIRSGHEKDEINTSIKEFLSLFFSDEDEGMLNGVLLNGVSVKPNNVAVLVRNNSEGREVKRILSDLKISSVIFSEESVFSSEEAEEIKNLLTAVLDISKNSIYRLLLTNLVGAKVDELFEIDYDKLFPFFYELKGAWEKDGVFVMLNKFMNEFKLVEKWKRNNTLGQQKLSNIQQLIDILKSKEQNDSLTSSELIEFLNQQMKEKPIQDSYVQGIESDEEAVKIMTIHKSKGLEFDIVLLPYLSVKPEQKWYYKFTSFRKKENDKNNYYFGLYKVEGDNEVLFEEQEKEENKRLLYVGVTRAKYNTIILTENPSKDGTNLLYPYVEYLKGSSDKFITVEEFSKREDWSSLKVREQIRKKIKEQKSNTFPDVKFPDANYHKMSYSFLAGSHAPTKKEAKNEHSEGTYGHFIFKELAKGAHIGNLLHDIFEFIDFTDEGTWQDQIKRSVLSLLPSRSKDEKFHTFLYEMVKHTVNASINIGNEKFSLNKIPRNKRINELEFNFPIKEEFSSLSLEYVLAKEDPRKIVTSKGAARGMMNGFVDLFFEHEGKYYILDWKSNFLGDDIEHYGPEGILSGMNEGNYHLQYLLYTIAVEKYLKSRLGEDYNFEKHFGGIIYVFLRGVREGQESGFYVNQVSQEEREKIRGILKLDSL